MWACPYGFRHKTGENDLNADIATAYIARFEKNGGEGDIIANIPDLEKGHENPYVIALMREAFDYYTGAKHHVKKAHKNREQEDGSAQIEEVKKLENNFCEICPDVRPVYEKFMQKEKIYFRDLKPNTIPDGLCGVYAIFDEKTDEALYVGRTTRMSDRLSQHLKGRKMAAPLKKYLIKEEELKNFFGEKMLSDKKLYDKELYDKAGEWIRDNCYFKYIEIGTVEDFRERGHTEGLLGFLLPSRYIEKEH